MTTITIEIFKKKHLKFLLNLLRNLRFSSEIKVSHDNFDKNISYESEYSKFKDNFKEIPIEWPDIPPKGEKLYGIWEGKNITIEKIREKAWKRN